jgi:hypothetical protein
VAKRIQPVRALVEIPGYTIETELGHGGMAKVYLASQLSINRQVALKIMSPLLLVDASFSERFMREARIAANLNHAHIVAVHDVGVCGDYHYLAMEFLPAGDLASRCKAGMDVAAALRVTREIAEALDYAHGKGFVHRDIKPENIMFREGGSSVLTDFGIARAVDSMTQMTKTGAVVGTPQYMSPEQARGRDLDGRSDLYSLGIVLYEMLTGNVPFAGADSVSVGIKHVTEAVPPLPSQYGHLQRLLDRFLAKAPEDRFQTGAQAVAAIQDLEHHSRARAADMEATVAQPAFPGGQAAPQVPPKPAQLEPSKPVHVSATPRPDGTLRREPTLGSLDEIGSFDRTMSQPVGRMRDHSAARRPGKRGGSGWLVALALLAGLAGVGWWQQDRLLALLPSNAQTAEWLDQAIAAEQQGRWYGEGPDQASSLYQRVLDADPGNRAAQAGLRRVAAYLIERADQALVDGNPAQNEMLLQRAAELAPDLVSRSQRTLPEPVVETPQADPRQQQLQALVAEGQSFASQGKIMGPDGDNAIARFKAALAIDADDPDARRGLDEIADRLVDDFGAAVAAEQVGRAEELLLVLDGLGVSDESLDPLRGQLGRLRDTLDQREQAARELQATIAGYLARGDSALAADRISNPAGDNAIAHYRSALELDPENAEAKQGLKQTASRLLVLSEIALEDDRLDQAGSMIAEIETLEPNLSGLDRARRRLELYRQQRQRDRLQPEQRIEMQQHLVGARLAMERGDLMSPPVTSAYDRYKAVLRLDPNNEEARAGLRQLSGELVVLSRNALSESRLDLAFAYLGDARQTDPENPLLVPLGAELALALREGVQRAIDASELDEAEVLLQHASELAPDHADLNQLQLKLNIARDAAGG